MQFLIIILLIIVNGLFAMAEIAVVSSRKSKLRERASKGDENAKKTLELAGNPNRFLSTVQIGITFVGIFAGAFGGETIAEDLAVWLAAAPVIGAYAETIALVVVVAVITYLSLVIGELVPKRLALHNPEDIAARMVRPMQILSDISAPLVRLLSLSTDALLKVLRVPQSSEQTVSEDEVRMLIQEGTRRGVFNFVERDIVERTFRLSDKKVTALMTPRKDIKWLDVNATPDKVHRFLTKHPYSYYPVCRGALDKVVGVIRAKEVLTYFLKEKQIDVQKHIRKPTFVPEGMDSMRLLESFKKSGVHVAIVVDEFGGVEGLLSLTDILEAIVGDIPTIDELRETDITKREDGSFLVDGLVTLDEFKEAFRLKKLPDETRGEFYTIGGFVVHTLGTIPKAGDTFVSENLQFEVMDMDGNRVDKVLVRESGT